MLQAEAEQTVGPCCYIAVDGFCGFGKVACKTKLYRVEAFNLLELMAFYVLQSHGVCQCIVGFYMKRRQQE